MDWQEQEAQRHLTDLLRAVREDGAQFITKNDEPFAVVITVGEYDRLRAGMPTFKSILRGPPYVEDFDVERSKDPGRDIDLSEW